MAGKLLRLTEKLYNTPHIITQARLDGIFDYLSTRNNEELVNEAAVLKGEYEATELSVEDGVAILDLRGTTVYKETGFDAFCGLLSYQNTVRNIDTILSKKDEVKLVVAFIESPGGEAYRAFETGRYIRDRLKEYNIPSVAYVDGIAASGGYVLASAFDEVISNPDSEIGSIGVRIALRNPKKEDKITYITAGENKVPFDEEGDFKPEFIQKLQKGVNETYDKFVTYVADMRGMTREAVINTKADTFSAKDSMSLGLIDKVMDGEQFLNYVADLKDKSLSNGNSLNSVRIETDSLIEDEQAIAGEDVNINADEGAEIISEVSSEEENNNNQGDIMSDKDTQVDIEALVAKQVAEATQALQAQLSEATEVAQALKDEKEALALAAKQKEEALQAELDKQEMEDLQIFVKGLGIGTEEDQKQLSEALFGMRNVEGVEVAMDFLDKMKVAKEAANTQLSVEDTNSQEDALPETEVRKSRVSERLRKNAQQSKL